MKIGIIGAGAIGMLFGSKLAAVGEVTFFVRRLEQAEAIRKYGIIRHNDEKHIAVHACVTSAMDKQDCLFVCVKQHQLKGVLPFIRKNNAQTPLFFIQNGMGHLKWIETLDQPVFSGVVEQGAVSMNDYTFTHTGEGAISFAGKCDNKSLLEKLVAKLSTSDFRLQVRNDMHRMLAEKLVINAVINPLTAIMDVNNGSIGKNPHLRCLAEQLCKEACIVLELDEGVMWERIMGVAEKTAMNMSSMRKDLREGRKTENDAISGYILQLAEQDVPSTWFVWHAVKALEKKGGIGND